MSNTSLKPLFKWTGGKTKMRSVYGSHFWPEKPFTRFIDCFYGAGSMTHWVAEKYPNVDFVINDFNSEMIQLYEVIRDHYTDLVVECQKLETAYFQLPGTFIKTDPYNTSSLYKNRHEYYTKIKLSYINEWQTMGRIKESAYLYFLMKTSFNGWWKIYNYSKGRYATPPGLLSEKTNIFNIDLMKQHSEFFKNRCVILSGDYQIVKPYVTDSSYVYFDPPYRDSSTEYTNTPFNDNEQIKLCEFFKECHQIGASVSLSNKEIGDGFFYQHLGEFDIKIYDNVKYTAGRGTTTNKVSEVLVKNWINTSVEHSPISELFTFL